MVDIMKLEEDQESPRKGVLDIKCESESTSLSMFLVAGMALLHPQSHSTPIAS